MARLRARVRIVTFDGEEIVEEIDKEIVSGTDAMIEIAAASNRVADRLGDKDAHRISIESEIVFDREELEEMRKQYEKQAEPPKNTWM